MLIDYKRGTTRVKLTGKPHIMKCGGIYYTFGVRAVLTDLWEFTLTREQLKRNLAATEYCRKLNGYPYVEEFIRE